MSWDHFKAAAKASPCGPGKKPIGQGSGAIRDLKGWHIVLSYNAASTRWMLAFTWTGSKPEAGETDRAFCFEAAAKVGAPSNSAVDYRWPIANAEGIDCTAPGWTNAVDAVLAVTAPGARQPLPINRLLFTWVDQPG